MAYNQRETQKDILSLKAHEKQLSSVLPNKGHPGSPTAGSVDGDGNPKGKLVRSRHKHQCELYNRQKKAKKVQQTKQTANNNKAPGTSATPPKAGQ